jgi:bifunctional DNA-binding transcriptional regulator/antitoxin component of YhaV-PrlF toxin-antitoxin module
MSKRVKIRCEERIMTQKPLASTLTDNGQTTVPREIREALGIKPRQRLQWDLTKDGNAIVRAQPNPLDLFGSLKPAKRFPGLKEEEAAGEKLFVARFARKGRSQT